MNRLKHQRLNDLVYVHYKLRLKDQYKCFLSCFEFKFFHSQLWIIICFSFFSFYNKKKTYDPIDYACIDETNFWMVDEDEPIELDVEELKNLLYEEGSILINEVEGSSSHIG